MSTLQGTFLESSFLERSIAQEPREVEDGGILRKVEISVGRSDGRDRLRRNGFPGADEFVRRVDTHVPVAIPSEYSRTFPSPLAPSMV